MTEIRFRIAGVDVSLDEFDDAVKFGQQKSDKESQRYAAAWKRVMGEVPGPATDREKELLDLGFRLGFISAMADGELWWRLHNRKNIEKSAANRVTKSGELVSDRDARLAARYSQLKLELTDLATRRQLCDEFPIKLPQINQILVKLGLRTQNKK